MAPRAYEAGVLTPEVDDPGPSPPEVDHDGSMPADGPFPLVGEVIWLGTDQGGRRSGPPTGTTYASVAFIPPHTIEEGVASFVLRGWDPTRHRSPAEASWLMAEPVPARSVEAGTVVWVTEGTRLVALFVVDEVRPT
jgi:hypothetical protein